MSTLENIEHIALEIDEQHSSPATRALLAEIAKLKREAAADTALLNFLAAWWNQDKPYDMLYEMACKAPDRAPGADIGPVYEALDNESDFRKAMAIVMGTSEPK